jgi:hypothetical protein
MSRILYLLAGALFGWLLHQARATDYDTIVGMFRLKDLHLMGVMGVAIGVTAVGLFALKRAGLASGVHPKPMRKWILVAGMMFGVGWALTGA